MSDAYDTPNDTRQPHDAPEDRPRTHVAIDPLKYAGMPPGGYEQHPLFPREDNSPELRDIQFVSFRRRSSDGAIDNLAEDLPAGEVLTWADVVGPWGGGEYKAIGKDKNHRIVAWYPEKNGEWMRFDLESKPFTLRGQRYRSSAVFAAPAAAYAPAMAAPPPAHHPQETTIAELVRELRVAKAPPPVPRTPPAHHPLETAIAELIHELRASRAPVPSLNDSAMVELIKSQGEFMRTVLGSVLAPRLVEPSVQSNGDPMATALQGLGAGQKLTPTHPLHDRLREDRTTIREITAPRDLSPSERGELVDLFRSVMGMDELSKSIQEMLMRPPGPERRPPPPPPRVDARPVDYEALLRDPTERQRMLNALGLDRPTRKKRRVIKLCSLCYPRMTVCRKAG